MTATFNCTMSTSTRMLVSPSWAGVRGMEPKKILHNVKKRRYRFAVGLIVHLSAPESGVNCKNHSAFVFPINLWQGGNFALAKLLAGFAHGPQNRRPVLEVGGKN